MIPQVAHHPRHLSQQFGIQGCAAPPFDPVPQSRRTDTLTPLSFRSSRNDGSSLAPQYRAFPVENHGGRRFSAAEGKPSNHGLGGQYNDPAEHLLRRKTPNGTLAAGYDGTPVQWSNKAPALKHVVLPFSSSSSPANGTYSGTALDIPRNRGRAESLGGAFQQAGQVPHFKGRERSFQHSQGGTPWPQPNFPVESPQNVWDHIRQQQASSFYPSNAMQIPTVLQPPYQPSPGPTASDDGGFYGPYWPDGRFVPYRPAAVREQGGFGHQRPPPFLNHGFGQQFLAPTELLPPFRHLSFDEDPCLAARPGHAGFSLQNSGMAVPQFPYTPSTAFHTTNGNTAFYEMHDNCRTPTAQSPSKANNTRFKEKTLSWAHSIYVDLLAYLYQTRKEGRKSRQSNGIRTYTKNSIYPKPPRQPASHLSSTHWSDLDSNDSKITTAQSHAGAPPGLSRVSSLANFRAWQGTSNLDESCNARSLHQDVPHYVQIPPQCPISPLSRAKEALDMLTNLCDESGWCWIDGMLLGGCLAYGLEEYHKALDWYSKIIVLDPK